MQLRVIDRIALLQVLPRQGSVLDVRALHELRMALALSDEEWAAVKAAAPEGNLDERSPAAIVVKDVEVGSRARTIVEDVLTTLDREKKLPESCLGAWDAFFPPDVAQFRKAAQ